MNKYKSTTHKTIHLLAQEKEGSLIKPMKSYKLAETKESLAERMIPEEFSGLTVIAVRPHPTSENTWQVETGNGLIWVNEQFLEEVK